MRSNKVWDVETAERAGLPVVTEGNEKQDNVFELNDNKDKKDGFLEGSLAAAEAVQDETDKRRSAAVTKSNLKGLFTIFLFLVRSHILSSNGVWYS